MYKADIPALKEELQKLRDGFSGLGTKTDWTKLRVEPLLRHAESLERQLNSEVFSREFSRLTKGVAMFHSDLVYLRTNVKELKKLLQSEKSHIRF